MKVVITHTSFLIYWKPRLRALYQALKQEGHHLIVMSVTSKGTNCDFIEASNHWVSGIEWINLFGTEEISILSPHKVAKALWNRLETLRPDVIVAAPIAFTPGATAVRWCRHRKRPVVIMDDVRTEDVPRSCLVNYVKRRIYNNVDAMFIPARSHLRSYVKWGVSPEKVFFGFDVVDNEFFESRSRTGRANLGQLRTRHKLPNRFFLGVGRQVPKKNWPTLITAYERYRQSIPSQAWDLVLVGEGPEHRKLERYVTERHVPGVHFRPFANQEKLCEYYAMAECLVLASYYETWGLVVNEAMACSLPVLVSKQCGCAESLVQEGKNGWTFSPENVDELTDALIKITKLTTDKLGAIGRKSQAIIAEWPLERFAEGILAAIQSSGTGCGGVRRFGDRWLLKFWKGRFRPT